MRFDDKLATVLAAETATPFGVQSAWRQLTDLIARGLAPATPDILAWLVEIRPRVPTATRLASARVVAQASPPGPLVRLFAGDEPAVAAPVLAAARLAAGDWLEMIATLPPPSRALIRERRDLPEAVRQALATFGPADFALPQPLAKSLTGAEGMMGAAVIPEATTVLVAPEIATDATEPNQSGFTIAELVARLHAYESDRANRDTMAEPALVPVERFVFEADADHRIRWVDGAQRESLVGLFLDRAPALAELLRRHEVVRQLPLGIGEHPALAGFWLLTANPAFDRISGRFIGYCGIVARPRRDPVPTTTPEALRGLVHELRTPATALTGFAEMIEGQVLGPAAPPYRERAGAIRRDTADLLGAIEDLDTAARLEQGALGLQSEAVPLAQLLSAAAERIEPLMLARRCSVEMDDGPAGLAIVGDRLALTRLIDRMIAIAVDAASPDEVLRLDVEIGPEVLVRLDRPAAWAGADAAALLARETSESPGEGGPLLGPGFTLGLARALAAAIGGALDLDERLTLRLRAVEAAAVGQSNS